MSTQQKQQAGLLSNLISKVPRRNFLRKTLGVFAGVGAAATTAAAQPTSDALASAEPAMASPRQSSEPFLGEISMFGGTFAPRGWALCDGQLLPISQYTALFSLLGTTYGGDGRTTFGLPDLRGRAPIHAGQGPGLTDRRLGEKDGTENETLTVAEMPSHTHDIPNPADVLIRGTEPEIRGIPTGSDESASTLEVTAANTGGSQPHNNMPPFLAVNYIIALEGTFPQRN